MAEAEKQLEIVMEKTGDGPDIDELERTKQRLAQIQRELPG